ncbi:nucleotide pyrophosphohydrolase [Chitinimonas naiadis]
MSQDNLTTLADLKQSIARFAADRDWHRFHTGKNLAMSIAIEAAELMEHFQWEPEADGQSDPAEVAEELADVLIYALAFANSQGIDVASAIKGKLAKNETRFPSQGGKPLGS